MSSSKNPFLPNDRDLAFYREHGWYVSPIIVPDDVLESALVGCARYYANDTDRQLPEAAHYFDWKQNNSHTLRTNAYASLQIDELRELVSQPVIGAAAARLAGTDCIRLFRDQLIWKPPKSRNDSSMVGWHCDRAYWLMCTSENMISAWVPFSDCSERNGTLVVLDKSHLWPGNTAIRGFGCQDMDMLEAKFSASQRPVVKIPLEVRRGQVVFHHCNTVHGSAANLTKNPRIALSIHLQDGENRYQRVFNNEGQPLLHLNDLLCRRNTKGEPDYTDPAICPVLWCQG